MADVSTINGSLCVYKWFASFRVCDVFVYADAWKANKWATMGLDIAEVRGWDKWGRKTKDSRSFTFHMSMQAKAEQTMRWQKHMNQTEQLIY